MARTTINVKRVMDRAHEIRRTTSAETGCKPNDVVFSLCLKMAWAEAKAEATAETSARNVLTAWEIMPDADRVKEIRRAVWAAAAVHGEYIGLTAAEVLTDDEDAYISETWLRIGDRLDNSPAVVASLTARNMERAERGKPALTLVNLLTVPARAGIAAIARARIKHSAASVCVVEDADGKEQAAVDVLAVAPDDTEKQATDHVVLDEFLNKLDETDREIVRGVVNHKPLRKIGKQLGISHVAVHKRLVKIRAALMEQGFTD